MGAYTYPRYPYRACDDLRVPADAPPGTPPQRRALVIIGAGPVGLAAAIDARLRGLPVLVFDEDDTVSIGSRAVCYAKRALEIMDRLGVGDAVCARGVSWNVGRTFSGEQEVYRFNLVPEPGHERPGMINLQQYQLEELLIARALELGVDLRFRVRLLSLKPDARGVRLQLETPEGPLTLDADWLIAADGARSPIRRMLGLAVDGRIFMDRFLIADVVMQADFPAERWLWFDPPFHPGQTVLLHKQADQVWRIDFQLGWNADPEEEKKPERVIPRIRAMLGDDRPFELEWVSVYTFQCRRMKDFRHGRVLFVGDAAHQVSPFGARGANSGLQDTDDLIWKLQAVIEGRAPDRLLDSYSADRVAAADENLMNSTRSTDFITPKSRASRVLRDAVLDLAREHPFARALVNSGRLSVPAVLTGSVLNTPDADLFDSDVVPGAPLPDAPLGRCDADSAASADNPATWLLRQVGGPFTLLLFCDDAPSLSPAVRDALAALASGPVPVQPRVISARACTGATAPLGDLRVLHDVQGMAAARLDARPGTCYLIRPDQHVAARWRSLEPVALRAALARALGHLGNA